MSLNQRYTWHDFLKEHPEFKEKGIKRMSPEGKKAFDASYKAFIKNYLAERSEKLTKLIERSTKRRDERIAKLKDLRKTKKKVKAKRAQLKVGRSDAAIAHLKKEQTRVKEAQKNA